MKEKLQDLKKLSSEDSSSISKIKLIWLDKNIIFKVKLIQN